MWFVSGIVWNLEYYPYIRNSNHLFDDAMRNVTRCLRFFSNIGISLAIIILVIIMTGCFGWDWTSEIEMADGESIVKITQSGCRMRIEIGLKNGIDRDVILIEDATADIHSFGLSLPGPDNNDIYILDLSDVVQDVQSKRYKIHIIRDYMQGDLKTYSIRWIDPEMNKKRDTYHIWPSLKKIKKEPIE